MNAKKQRNIRDDDRWIVTHQQAINTTAHMTLNAAAAKIVSTISAENALHLIGAILFGHFMVALDNLPLPLLVQESWYYRDFALTSIFAWIILKYVSSVTTVLDRRWNWTSTLPARVGGQLIAGVGGAALAAYMISYLQYKLLDPEHVFGTDSFLAVEYPVIVLITAGVNFLYVVISFHSKPSATSVRTEPVTAEPVKEKTFLLVEIGHHRMPVPIDKIAYCQLHSALTWVCTFDNELYRIDKSLSELMPLLPAGQFFRVNRQTIIHIRACRSFKSEAFGKITIQLIHPFSLALHVSQKTAPAFRKWLAGNN